MPEVQFHVCSSTYAAAALIKRNERGVGRIKAPYMHLGVYKRHTHTQRSLSAERSLHLAVMGLEG